uniref:Uncharacterized protein n=1 Tax=Timema poppense TaxID=170557 RepID=A0A7R9HGS6_TIMPO|nr:unnamed protein product [Timema poppensis]
MGAEVVNLKILFLLALALSVKINSYITCVLTDAYSHLVLVALVDLKYLPS